MKSFKNKLAVTVVVLSVAFLGIIFISLKGNSNFISSGVGSVISPLQKIIYKANDKLKVAIKAIDKASQKGVTAKNTAARNKSRLTKKVNEMK